MKHVLLMRHAKSSWKVPSLSDHQRPLNESGKRDAPLMGRHIREEAIRVDVILCSTATRARATAEGFLQEYTFEGEVHHYDDLYLAGPETIVSILNQLPDSVGTAMVIAHNPGLEDFLGIVCEECGHMPTASLAYISYSLEHWVDLREHSRGDLVGFWKPREL